VSATGCRVYPALWACSQARWFDPRAPESCNYTNSSVYTGSLLHTLNEVYFTQVYQSSATNANTHARAHSRTHTHAHTQRAHAHTHTHTHTHTWLTTRWCASWCV
jgi:hypothetical protein